MTEFRFGHRQKKLYNPEKVLEEYKVTSKNLLLSRIFEGDQSDNIKGVMGIGVKTLLKHIPNLGIEPNYYTIEDILKQATAQQDGESSSFIKQFWNKKIQCF